MDMWASISGRPGRDVQFRNDSFWHCWWWIGRSAFQSSSRVRESVIDIDTTTTPGGGIARGIVS